MRFFVKLVTIICLIFTFYILYEKLQDYAKKNDEKKLDDMWRNLLVRSTFGYTLLSDKPVSVVLWNKNPIKIHNISFLPDYLYVGENKNLWKSYSKNISSEYFMLFFSEFSLDNQFYEEAILINIQELNKVLDKYAENFILFRKQFDDLKSLVIAVLRSQQHDLIGIILGFGKTNSDEFYKPYILRQDFKNHAYFPNQINLDESDFEWLTQDIDNPYTNQLINKSSPCFSEEVKKVSNKALIPISALNKDNPLCHIPLPIITIDVENLENKTRLAKYKLDQKKIIKFTEKNNLVNDIISLFTKGQPT